MQIPLAGLMALALLSCDSSSDLATDGGTSCASSCPGVDTECQTRVCNAQGQCDFSFAARGTVLTQQQAGDCVTAVCDGSGSVSEENDDDDFDDMLECTSDSCFNGTPEHSNLGEFTACPATASGICDGQSACLTCIEANCFSDGSDGAFTASANQDLIADDYNFTSFVIRQGVTVRIVGTAPLFVKTQGATTIRGALVLRGGAGGDGISAQAAGLGGDARAGGNPGGAGGYDAVLTPVAGSAGAGPGAGGGGATLFSGAGAGHAEAGGANGQGGATLGAAYGDVVLSTLTGGSGGGGGSGGAGCGGGGGGGGGGAARFISFGTFTVAADGVINARGGSGGTDGGGSCGGGGGGSGGSLWITATDLVNNGRIDARGGTGGAGLAVDVVGGSGSPGRIRTDVINSTGDGTIVPAAGHNSGAWYQ